MPVGNPSPTHTSGPFVLRPWAYLQAGTPAVSMARVSIDFGREGLWKIPSSLKFCLTGQVTRVVSVPA